MITQGYDLHLKKFCCLKTASYWFSVLFFFSFYKNSNHELNYPHLLLQFLHVFLWADKKTLASKKILLFQVHLQGKKKRKKTATHTLSVP